MFERWSAYARLMRLDKPIGSLLLLWPTLWALWIAGQGQPDPRIVLIFVAGVFVMRSAGCVMNDIADRNFDPHVERTKDRPLANSEISVKAALVLFVVLGIIALALIATLNRPTIYLAAVGLLLAVTYPFTKRITMLPQLYLGVAFGWGIPMAFSAHLETVSLTGWLVLLANIFWAGAYDTFYAMVDRDDDLRIGVKSLAVLSGQRVRQVIGVFQVLTLATLILVGVLNQFNGYYYLGLCGAATIAVWHQYMCRNEDRDKCFKAFLGNSWFGASVFGGVVLAYL